MVVASRIPFVRKHFISVLAFDTVSPNAAHTTTTTPIILLTCLGKRETTPASSAYIMPYSDFARAGSPSVAPSRPPAPVLFLRFLISLMADGPNVLGVTNPTYATLPSCLGQWRIFPSPPVLAFRFFSRCKFSTLTTRQPMVEFDLLTFSCFPLGKTE